MKKCCLVLFITFNFSLFANSLNDCNRLILLEQYKICIDEAKDESEKESDFYKKDSYKIRGYIAIIEDANLNQIDISNQIDSFDLDVENMLKRYKNSSDFNLMAGVYNFTKAKYFDDLELSEKFAEQGESYLKVSADISPNNKDFFMFSAKIYAELPNLESFYNPSYSISLMRKYLMLSEIEDFLGNVKLAEYLKLRNWDLQERTEGISQINLKLRRLSDPFYKNRYLEGFKNFASFNLYTNYKSFLSISDSQEADYILKYVEKLPKTEAEKNYISEKFWNKDNQPDNSNSAGND